MKNETYCGFVALIGQPNVGKSTLLNQLLGKKLSITSKKPQTTRHRILGIKTIQEVQIVYLDTPGLHSHTKRAINRIMNRAAKSTFHDVDVIVFVVEALQWNRQDAWILSMLKDISTPIILAINKIDQLVDRTQLLPFIEKINQQAHFVKVIPLSAKKAVQVDQLEKEIIACLPQDRHYFPPEQFTDRSDRFILAEIIREKLTRLLGQELPYSLTVMVEAQQEEENIVRVSATIYVEKPGQKAIIIGKRGEKLKQIGQKARLDMESFFSKKVYLQLWVKVKGGWADDERALKSFGYET